MKNMNVLEIVEEYLIKFNFDGLFNSDLECGCFLGDLCPCESDFCQCEPGVTKVIDHAEFGPNTTIVGPREEDQEE